MGKLVRSIGRQANLACIRERSAASTTGPSRMAFPLVAAQASAVNSTAEVFMEAGAGNSYSR
jgi:hypothetical protein